MYFVRLPLVTVLFLGPVLPLPTTHVDQERWECHELLLVMMYTSERGEKRNDQSHKLAERYRLKRELILGDELCLWMYGKHTRVEVSVVVYTFDWPFPGKSRMKMR